MTRRYPDMRVTRDEWTDGDKIAAGIAFIVGILLIIGAVALIASVTPALARDLGQWENSDPRVKRWFESLRQPDNPEMSCCGEADAYWADQVEIKDGQVIAVITDTRPDEPLRRRHVPPGTRIVVPPHKLKWDRGNPVGHVVIFLNALDLSVLCYVQNGGV